MQSLWALEDIQEIITKINVGCVEVIAYICAVAKKSDTNWLLHTKYSNLHVSLILMSHLTSFAFYRDTGIGHRVMVKKRYEISIKFLFS